MHPDRFCRLTLSDKVSPPSLLTKVSKGKVYSPRTASTLPQLTHFMASVTVVRPSIRIPLTAPKRMHDWKWSGTRSCRSLHTSGHQRWTATSHPPLFLDFLIPAQARRAPKYLSQLFREQPVSAKSQCRRISTSSPRQATIIAANPRKDEDGNNMVVDITPRASNVSLSLLILLYEARRVMLSLPSN